MSQLIILLINNLMLIIFIDAKGKNVKMLSYKISL